MQRNFKLTLAYDGTDFCGWQVQPQRATLQGALANAIERVTGERVLPQGSGRTDAGVHALAQVASVALESPIPADNLLAALNHTLPPSIRVTAAEEAPFEFHARHSVKSKTYEYRILRASICSPFIARYVHHHPYPLDEGTMRCAADLVRVGGTDPEGGRAVPGPRHDRSPRLLPPRVAAVDRQKGHVRSIIPGAGEHGTRLFAGGAGTLETQSARPAGPVYGRPVR